MVNSRLLWYLEHKHLLSCHQSGFRKGRCTTDHLVLLESSINKGFANKESTLAVFLDIQKAFDMLWRKGIIIKLQNMGICGRIIKWIDNFLTNRKIQVKINNTLSTSYTVQNGVPQGSVISPLLFNIAVNDLPDNITGIQISQYADDIALWKSNRNVQFLEKKIQNALNNVENWCKKWRFKLSASKTSAVLFTRKKDTNLNIYINKTKINVCKFAKFLGITFDQKLNWAQHINNVIDRCKN